MDTKEFFNGLEIEETDKDKAEAYIKSKGLFAHMQIKNKMLAWSSDKTIKYSQIASYYRYDKRIRIILYKYIAYLEEYYRAILLDNFSDSTEQNFWIKIIADKINSGIRLDIILENLGFRSLLNQIKLLPDNLKEYSFNYNKPIRKNIDALIELRNAVMHNKFLLMYRGFEMCYFAKGRKGSTLRDNILNLVNFLPEDVGVNCIKDINACKENRNTEKDTEWDLPGQALVVIE